MIEVSQSARENKTVIEKLTIDELELNFCGVTVDPDEAERDFFRVSIIIVDLHKYL